jgi:hypothetical protein
MWRLLLFNIYIMIRSNTEFVPTWYLLIDIFNQMKTNRTSIPNLEQKTEFKIAAINASMIVHIAAIVEGSINSLLINKLTDNDNYKKANRENDYEIIRLYESLLSAVQMSTWKDVSKSLSNTVLGFSLSDKDIFPDWEAIKYLFEFRNLLAHGGVIIKKAKMISNAKKVNELDKVTEEIKESLTKEMLFKFLAKKRLIELPNYKNYMGWKVINSETTDFFTLNAKKFVLAVYEKFSESNSINHFSEQDIEYIKMIN